MGNNAKSSGFKAPAGRNIGFLSTFYPYVRPAGAWNFAWFHYYPYFAPLVRFQLEEEF
jgi:hypothetical protein